MNGHQNMVTTNGLLTIDDVSLCNDEFVLSMHTGENKLDIRAKSQMETLLNWTYEKEQGMEQPWISMILQMQNAQLG